MKVYRSGSKVGEMQGGADVRESLVEFEDGLGLHKFRQI